MGVYEYDEKQASNSKNGKGKVRLMQDLKLEQNGAQQKPDRNTQQERSCEDIDVEADL